MRISDWSSDVCSSDLKWTLLVLEELEEHGTCRFTRLAQLVPGISQKMLTQTLRAMERDGLVHRKVHPVIPPKVEYRLTALGQSLGEAFCGVWHWAEAHLCEVEAAGTLGSASCREKGCQSCEHSGFDGEI